VVKDVVHGVTPCFSCGVGGTHIQRYRRPCVCTLIIAEGRPQASVTTRFSLLSSLFVMTHLPLRSDHITLAQAVKAAGLGDTGGQAKYLVREGTVRVNGVSETQPGRKLFPGDRFGVEGGEEWTISR